MQKAKITFASFGMLSALALLCIAWIMITLPFFWNSDYSSRPLEIKQKIWIIWGLSSIPAGLSIYLIIGYLKVFFSSHIPTKTYLWVGALSFGICALASIWSAVVNGMLSLPWTNTPDILWSMFSLALFGISTILHISFIRRHIKSELSTPLRAPRFTP